MSSFVITDTKQSMAFFQKEARDLELKLNVTSKGHEWMEIADALFAIHSNHKDAVTRLVVTTEQYTFLKKLNERLGWESCKDM